MIYIEYEQYRATYLRLQEAFNHYLTEKERLITRTLPNAVRYDKDITSHGTPDTNPLESYVISLEETGIDKHLDRVRSLLDDRKRLLDLKEQELRMSQDLYDKVYRMRFLDGFGINKIAKILNYSRAQIYRICDQITKKIKHETK